MANDIVVGRLKEDFQKYGSEATAYLGKHIVGKGEEAHLTNKILMDLLRPHVILICGKRGAGKCIEENTLITLDDGSLIPIKDLEGNENKVLSLNNQLKISTASKSQFSKRKVNKILKITLRSGRDIKLTPEHQLLTVNGWKDAKELLIGSRIATARKIKTYGNELMKECEIKLLAYLIAEGHLSNNFILFSNSDQEIIDDFKNSVRDFDSTLKILPHGKNSLRISSSERKIDVVKMSRDKKGKFSKGIYTKLKKNSLRVLLEELNIYGKLAKEKTIPQKIFKLPEHQLSLFLNRLFSCDGSIHKHRIYDRHQWVISYSSSSELLIKQVQHLLLRFSIISKIRKKIIKLNKKVFANFEIEIRGQSLIDFIKNIGFFGAKASKQKEALDDLLKLVRNFNWDTIPKEVWNLYKPSNWTEIGQKMGYIIPKSLRESIKYSPTREKLMQIALLDNNESMYLLATSDIFWDEIVSIEELEGDFTVCDIEVPEYHNFLANDIIVHNSYFGGVVAEEIALLPEKHRKNLTTVMIDTMGIYWSMKLPNEDQVVLLDEWGLKPIGLKDRVKVYVPLEQKKKYEDAGIPVDFGISVPPYMFSAEEWATAFRLQPTNPLSIGLQKAVNYLHRRNEKFSIDDLVSAVKDDRSLDTHVKSALENMLTVANSWGVFGDEGVRTDEIMKPGMINVFDVSRLRSTEVWSVRNLLVALICKDIYYKRVLARKQEELARVGEIKLKERFPMVWLIIDEAHNFIPSDHETVSSGPLLTIVKQGREPGISLVPMTQMPNKIHPEVVSQADMVISHRLTSKNDLDALHATMQTYLMEDVWKYIENLPKWRGTSIILDDNSEKIFQMQTRPRLTWHAGESAIAVNP